MFQDVVIVTFHFGIAVMILSGRRHDLIERDTLGVFDKAWPLERDRTNRLRGPPTGAMYVMMH